MTQQHTPGPWTARYLASDPHGVIMIGGYEIVTTNYDVVGGNPGVAPIRNEMDARLIAAAPELLATCKAWLELVDGEGQGNCCGCNYQTQTEQARAAIAKATSPQAR